MLPLLWGSRFAGEEMTPARLTLHAASALKPQRLQGRGIEDSLPRRTEGHEGWRVSLQSVEICAICGCEEFINIALLAYALRLWLRAQTPQLRFGNILSIVNLLFCASKTYVARRAYSELWERC